MCSAECRGSATLGHLHRKKPRKTPENPSQQPDLARDLFELQHRRQGSNAAGHQQTERARTQVGVGWDRRRQGAGPEAMHRNFLGPNSLGPKRGRTAVRTADRKPPEDPQHPTREGRGGIQQNISWNSGVRIGEGSMYHSTSVWLL